MSKRIFSVLVTLAAVAVLGAACSKKTATPTENTSGTVNTDLNTSTVPANSSTTGDFSTSTNSSDSTNTNTGTVAAVPTMVSIIDMSFSPSSLSVKKGTTVEWTNNDVTTHTVTGTKGGLSNHGIAPGSTYSYTFDTVGTFPYHCEIHSSMTGAVTVTN